MGLRRGLSTDCAAPAATRTRAWDRHGPGVRSAVLLTVGTRVVSRIQGSNARERAVWRELFTAAEAHGAPGSAQRGGRAVSDDLSPSKLLAHPYMHG